MPDIDVFINPATRISWQKVTQGWQIDEGRKYQRNGQDFLFKKISGQENGKSY